jgi:hypothetical protein
MKRLSDMINRVKTDQNLNTILKASWIWPCRYLPKKNGEELGMSVDGGIADVANELVTKSSGKKSKK